MADKASDYCDICGRVVEHDHRLRVCGRCLEHGYRVLRVVLKKTEGAHKKVGKKET